MRPAQKRDVAGMIILKYAIGFSGVGQGPGVFDRAKDIGRGL